MAYQVLRNCIIEGAKVRAGDVIHISDSVARTMIDMGRVIPCDDIPKNSDRQVKEVQTRGSKRKTTSKGSGSRITARKGSGSASAGRDSSPVDSSENSDV